MAARWYAVTTPERVEHVQGRVVFHPSGTLEFRGPFVGDLVVAAYGPGAWRKVVPEPAPPTCSAWYSDIGGPRGVMCQRPPGHDGDHSDLAALRTEWPSGPRR